MRLPVLIMNTMKEFQTQRQIMLEYQQHMWNRLSPVASFCLISGSGSLG